MVLGAVVGEARGIGLLFDPDGAPLPTRRAEQHHEVDGVLAVRPDRRSDQGSFAMADQTQRDILEFGPRRQGVEGGDDVRLPLLEMLHALAGGISHPGIVDAKAGDALPGQALGQFFEHRRP
ncbi:hypothetical protein D9M70_622440 [compost metagenome]